jgi:perosamine synthetase
VGEQALQLEPGDEVIVPAITYVATAQCVVGVGARVVLAEIDPETFNIDPNDVERKMGPRTRAILPVHNNGLSADMDALIEIGERHPHAKYGPVPMVGDAARACGGGYGGTKVGKRGAMNIFSFQTSKNMTTLGEGGMVTTDVDAYAAYVKSARSFGWGLKGWGTNYRMTALQAVAGSIQLKRLDEMNNLRRERVAALAALLEGIPELILPQERPGYHHVWYGYTLLLERPWVGKPRDAVVDQLIQQYGVGTWVMNMALPDYDSIVNKQGHRPEDLPVSTDVGRRLLCPAVHPLMSDDDLRYITAALKASLQAVAKETGLLATVA